MAKRGKNRRQVLRRESDIEIANAHNSAGGAPTRRLIAIEGSVFQGPLPPPETLRGYEDVLPGAADRIIAMAEKNQAHRHALEIKVIPSGIINERIAQVLGFILYLASLIAGAYLIINDKEIAGLTEMLATTATFAGMYWYAQKEKRRELQRKRRNEVDNGDDYEEKDDRG